jgi:hypothetical protein
VLHERALAGHVALVHAADLRDGHVRLVYNEQEVLREVVEQAGRGAAGRAAVQVAAVVLDARAKPDLAQHLDVVRRAHAQPLGLEQLALALELLEPLLEFGLDAAHRALHPLGPGGVVRGRRDEDPVDIADHFTGEWVEVVQPLDLVAEHLDAAAQLLVDREDLDRIAAHPERAAGEREVVTGVLDVDELTQQLVAFDGRADAQLDALAEVLLGRTQAVDARDGGDDDDVPPGEQVPGGRVPQPLDLGVDRGILLDVGVGLRDVRLGLVVVVVADEVLDGVVRQHLAQLVGQLRRQGLVRRHDQGGPLEPFDQPRGRGRLARAGRAQEDVVLRTGADAFGQRVDGGGLVAGRLEVRDDLELPRRGLDQHATGLRLHGVHGTGRVRQTRTSADADGEVMPSEGEVPVASDGVSPPYPPPRR